VKTRSTTKKGENSQRLFRRGITKTLDSREKEFERGLGIDITNVLDLGTKAKRSRSKSSVKAQLA
jgi:hypothetical protein